MKGLRKHFMLSIQKSRSLKERKNSDLNLSYKVSGEYLKKAEEISKDL